MAVLAVQVAVVKQGPRMTLPADFLPAYVLTLWEAGRESRKL